MKTPSRIEAVAYALHQTDQMQSYIIYDLDENSVGYCTVTGKKTTLMNSKKVESENLWEGLVNQIPNFLEQIQASNQSVEQYLRCERMQDTRAFENEITCTKYEELLEPSRKMVLTLSEYVEQMVPEEVLENDVQIAVTGKLAQLYPIKFYIKEQLSGDPFLIDERFIEVQNPCTLVEEGIEQLTHTIALHTYELSLLDTDGRSTVCLKVTPDTEEDDIASLNFIQGVYVIPNQSLQLNVDDKQVELALPFTVDEKGELIDLVIRYIDEKLKLVIRKSTNIQKVYTIDLPILEG